MNGSSTPVKAKGKTKKNEEEEEEVFRWWEADGENDGSAKWQTLEHNGVIFPPPYETLPPDVKMKYNGMPFSLLRLCHLTLLPQANPWIYLLLLKKLPGFMGLCLRQTTLKMPPSTRTFSMIGKLF